MFRFYQVNGVSLRAIKASLVSDLYHSPRTLLRERKEFVRAFVEGVVVQPDKLRLDLRIRKIPALRPGNSTCLMVAGARYEALQVDLGAENPLIVAGKHLRFVA